MRLPFCFLLMLFPLLASCGNGGDPQGPFNGSGRTHKSQGNAEVQGPGAGDLIRQSRRDYHREKYDDRRYYGNY